MVTVFDGAQLPLFLLHLLLLSTRRYLGEFSFRYTFLFSLPPQFTLHRTICDLFGNYNAFKRGAGSFSVVFG